MTLILATQYCKSLDNADTTLNILEQSKRPLLITMEITLEHPRPDRRRRRGTRRSVTSMLSQGQRPKVVVV